MRSDAMRRLSLSLSLPPSLRPSCYLPQALEEEMVKDSYSKALYDKTIDV